LNGYIRISKVGTCRSFCAYATKMWRTPKILHCHNFNVYIRCLLCRGWWCWVNLSKIRHALHYVILSILWRHCVIMMWSILMLFRLAKF